jgi:large subunit ribosomal protein L24
MTGSFLRRKSGGGSSPTVIEPPVRSTLVQTTLLGIGFAIILALATALIGPFFVDWNGYRAIVESQASQAIGAPVHVSGPISLRLLPTPWLRLDGLEISPAGTPPVTAGRLAMEFGLSGLMRGELRANEMTVEGLDATVRLDRDGRIEAPLAGLGFDPDRLGIDRLVVTNGRISVADDGSGGRLALDHFNFTGEVRSLLGPFKGEGGFTAHDGPYAFRLGASRRGDDGGVKLHVFVDASAAAVSFDADGTVWAEGRAPRFEGAVTVSRVVGAALPDGSTAINEPWKATAKVKANAAGATASDLEFQYGPEVRPAHLSGTAKVEFGASPRATLTLGARQIDLDRIFAGSDRHPPFDVAKAMAESLAAMPAPPLPLRVALSVDNLTMAGASISMLHGEAERRADGWAIDSFEWRAPGATQMRIGGKLALAERKVAFTGPVRIDSTDPGLFFAWIEGRSAAGRSAVGPLRGSGVITLGSERVAVEDLNAEFDRKSVAGRAAYRFATAAAPARLDATLTAVELDLDRVLAIAEAVSASTSFERPKEIALALDIGRATYAGVEATETHAVLGFDGAGLKIERLSIADIGGAAVEASGRIDSLQSAARGSITLSLIAGRIEGLAGLAAKLIPAAAEPLRKYESRLGPLNIKARLDVEPGKGGAATSAAKLKLTGRIAGIDTNLDATGAGTLGDPGAAALRLEGRLDAEDGRTIAAFTGLDQLVNMERRPARLTFLAEGAAARAFRVDGKFAAGDIAASVAGTMKSGGDGTLDVALRAADAKLPHRAPATVAVDLRGKLAIAGGALDLTDLAGRVAGTAVKGRLGIDLGAVPRVEGRIEADQVDGAELVAVLAGAPRPAKGAAALWPTEPFVVPGGPALAGRIEFRAGSVLWAPGLTTRDLQGALVPAETGFSLEGVTGKLNDGRLDLSARMQRGTDGMSLQSHVKLVNADLAALMGGVTRVPATGRISVDAEVQGLGMSPASLVGSLKGSGLATLENVEIGGLDPTAMDAAITAVDRGVAINSARITEIANAGLDGGRLRLPFAAAPITIADGRVQLADLAAPAQSADIAASAALSLADNQVDMRIALTGPQRKNAPGGARPSLAVAVKGPLNAARRSVDVTSLVGWLTGRAVEQETKRLEEAERERKSLDPVGRRPDAATPAEPQAAVAATMGRAPDLPAPIEIKPAPPPPRRTAPPRPAPSPLDWFLQGNH